MNLEVQDSSFLVYFNKEERPAVKDACRNALVLIARDDHQDERPVYTNNYEDVMPVLGRIAMELGKFDTKEAIRMTPRELFDLQRALELFSNPATTKQAIDKMASDHTKVEAGEIEERALSSGNAADILTELREKMRGLRGSEKLVHEYYDIARSVQTRSRQDTFSIVFVNPVRNVGTTPPTPEG